MKSQNDRDVNYEKWGYMATGIILGMILITLVRVFLEVWIG